MELPNKIKDLKLLVSVLLKRIDDLGSEIVTLRSENVKLREENSALQSCLKQNSNNSHKPPSSDGLSKKPGLPKAAAKKTGGQKGHTGTTLRMVEQPDEVVVHHAISCPCCNKKFSGADVTSIIQKRQVFDIPKPRMEVTEHQLGMITCCGQRLYGAFPEKVSQPVQYGSRIKALSVLLNNDYKLPLQKIEQLMRDLWGCSFNESTVVNTNAGMYDSLQVVEQEIRANILATKLAHFDETGMRVSKKLHWFHAASTEMFTSLFVHSHRGKAAPESEDSLLKDYTHRAVHGCWATYFKENPKNSKSRNLINQFASQRYAWRSFAFVADVPFTNNQAERDIRHLKIKQKVTTNFQTFKGAQHYARIQSFSSTLRKHIL